MEIRNNTHRLHPPLKPCRLIKSHVPAVAREKHIVPRPVALCVYHYPLHALPRNPNTTQNHATQGRKQDDPVFWGLSCEGKCGGTIWSWARVVDDSLVERVTDRPGGWERHRLAGSVLSPAALSLLITSPGTTEAARGAEQNMLLQGL